MRETAPLAFMTDSRKTGLLRLAHLREMNEANAEAMEWQRERFARLADPASAPRVVSSFNLFQTPEALADRLASLVPLADARRILEPSAGLGRLYRAVRLRTSSPVVLVDVSPDCCRELYVATEGDEASRIVQGDFLACDAARLGGLFDVVIMNPPFKMGADIRHIKHARQMVAPYGALVSLCAAGPRQRAALQPIAREWIDLEPAAFKAEGTNVSAAIVIFDSL